MASVAPSNLTNPPSSQMNSTDASLAKGRKWMKILCWAELVLAAFAITFGSACTGINSGHERAVCTLGTGIWVGLLSLTCAAVGLMAIQPSANQRILLILYFLMCVAGAVASIGLMGVSCMWIEKASKDYKADNENYEMTSVTLNVFLLLAAICQTICTFLSAVLIMHFYWGWCCRSNDFGSSMAYIRADDFPDGPNDISIQNRPRRDNSNCTSPPRTYEVTGNGFFY